MKKNKRTIIIRSLSIMFTILFIVSFFMCKNALADTNTFTISNAVISERSITASGDIEEVKNDEIDNNIVFHTVGDYVVYKINVKNNLKKDITILSISDDNTNGYIEYKYDNHANELLKSNDSFDLEVKATYKNELLNINERKQSNKVNIIIKYEVDGSIEEDTIHVVPKTFDSIHYSIILLIISSIGLIVCIALDKSKKKKIKTLIVIGLIMTPIVVKALTYTFDISIVTEVSLLDKEVVTYIIDGVENTQVVPYNSYMAEVTAPVKDGYNYIGWANEKGEPFDFTTPISSDIKIIAKYEAIEYNLTIDLNGGNASNPNKYTIEDTITLNEPTKEGYEFAGWTGTDLTKPTKNLSFSGKTGNRSYTATYTPISYEIKYYGLTAEEEATLENPTTYTIESNLITLQNPSNRVDSDGDVYEAFTGWTYGESTSTNVTIPTGSTGKKEFTANFEHVDLDTYTITYDLVNGTVSEPNPNTYTIKTSTFTLHNPTKTGYDFVGWTGTGLSSPTMEVTIANRSTGDRSYTANYTKLTYQIQYSGISQSDAVALGNLESYDVETNSFTLVNPTKEGYTFDGWTGTGLTEKTMSVTINKGSIGDRNYTANFTPIDYDITYTLSGGSVTGNPTTYNIETGVIVLINPSKDGYTFKGWSGTDLTGDENTSVTIPSGATGDREYTANFTANKYNVIYDANGTNVTGTMANQELTYDVQDALTTNAYERMGYIFNGWNTDPDGLGTSYVDGADVINLVTSGDITLYAQWIDDMVTLSFDENGGNAVTDISVRRGDSISLPTPTNSDANQVFLGWYENLTDANSVSDPYTVTTDTELIAKWSAIICKKATTLHEDTCNGTNTSQGCRLAGMSVGDKYTFGNINRSDAFAVGDALDCDIDGSGYNTRFYYLYTKDDNAVLIAYNNYQADSQGNRGFGSTNNYTYSVKDTYIPNATEWTNLPVTFGDKAARIIEMEDLKAFTGKTEAELEESKSLINYLFLFENTSFNGNGSLKSTHWIIEWEQDGVATRGRIHKNTANVDKLGTSSFNSSNNAIRPVIEVPTILLDDSYIVKYETNGGTIANEYVSVKKGSSLGSLPTVTKTDYGFVGWFIDSQFNTQIDESHTSNGYETYYAKYLKSVEASTLEYTEFDLMPGESDTIVFYDENEVEPKTYASNDTSIVTVDENGNITANAVGTTNIVVTGTITGTTQVVTVKVQDEPVTCTVYFDEDGGDPVADMVIPKNATIGSVDNIPTTTKTDYVFGGWFTDNTFTHEVTNDTVVKIDITVIAKWIPADAVAVIGIDDYYNTIQSAINESTTTKTIKLLKDVTLSEAINLTANSNINKNIVLDLDGHTITVPSSAQYNAVRNKATLEIKNGTIIANNAKGAVNSEGGTVTISNMIITADTRQAVNNEGGNVIINGLVASSNTSGDFNGVTRGTVQNNSGTTTIISATITNTNGAAVSLGAGTLIVGTKNNIYDTDIIVIQGNTYGITAKTDFSLYDGMIKGKTAAVDNESKITSKEDNSTKVNDTEGAYNTLYYEMPVGQVTVTLDTDGGNLPPGASNSIVLSAGDQIGTLPEPTKGIYTFDGWFDENNQPVLSTRVVNQNETYHAVWSYTPSDTPVAFNMTNDVMMTYFNSIDTWKTQYTVSGTKADASDYTEVIDSTQFDTSMRANFDAHNCSYCSNDPNNNNCNNPSAGNRCELPDGYITGLSESINVYEYNTSTNEKTLVTYTTSDNGTIYNMIPGKTYRWESTSDSNVYGYINATAVRRTIYSSARNVRDLGGMSVSFTRNNTTKTGTLKYGKLYRGAELSNGQTDVDSLTKLGITREVDLRVQTEGNNPARLPKHDKCDGNCGTLPSTEDIVMTNYLIYPSYTNNYNALRDTLKYVMQSVVDGDSIYFHCTIGSDRTGTLAYFLEGLLGVPEEEKLEDYELSYFYGMLNRTRFHDSLANSSINPRFRSMYKTYDTNEKIFNWYMQGLTEEQIASEKVLIEQFRDAMIDYN